MTEERDLSIVRESVIFLKKLIAYARCRYDKISDVQIEVILDVAFQELQSLNLSVARENDTVLPAYREFLQELKGNLGDEETTVSQKAGELLNLEFYC